VQGLTAEQAQTAIEDRLRQQQIMRNPHVEVLVLEYATQGVTVAGEVKTPGIYPILGKRTVMDFVTRAGGPTSAASRTALLTHKNSSSQIVTLDLDGSVQPSPQPEVAVEPGDRIVVTRAGVVYVVGDVGRPGGYLFEHKDTITVLQALALAQGINKTAKLDAKLIRNTPGGRTESDLPLKKILANLAADPALQDGDILFVPVSGAKQWADKGMTSILQMAVGVVIYGRL
jgi:polysaccharide biosynthesis/export protein